MKIIIAGGGVAAFEAAAAARKTSQDCVIEIHSAENVPPYRRPALPGLICAGELDPGKIFIRKDEFYRENRITLYLDSRMTSMDPGKKEVTFNGNELCSYDRLILATGGRAFIPQIPGAENSNVLALRRLDDLEKLRSALSAGAKKITIAGGGILGIEIADALLECGAEVTLVERSERLLKRDISAEDSQMMMESLAGVKNFRLLCNASVKEVTPSGAVLTDGRELSSDLVIFSTGSRPELAGISKEIAVDRGILVNSRMETGVPGVFACGDNCEFDGKVCGLYTTSRAMAAVAGTNAAGGDMEYVPKANSIMLNALGFKMSSDGKVTKK